MCGLLLDGSITMPKKLIAVGRSDDYQFPYKALPTTTLFPSWKSWERASIRVVTQISISLRLASVPDEKCLVTISRFSNIDLWILALIPYVHQISHQSLLSMHPKLSSYIGLNMLSAKFFTNWNFRHCMKQVERSSDNRCVLPRTCTPLPHFYL